ncbi:MAG: hypothetical protein NVS2B14_04210 [Chamaesiphon sp.]
MLHRSFPEELICITQPLHAWVSGCLARAWGNEEFGQVVPRKEVCLGAEQHDIGWLLWERMPTLNEQTGYPHSFTELPTQLHLEIWSGAKHLALPLGRYPALLISLHGTRLYERFRGWQKSAETTQLVQTFLEHEYAFQQKLMTTLSKDEYYAPYVTPEVISRNRSLIALWDLLSLILCHGFQGEKQVEQVPTALDETTLTLTSEKNNPFEITVSPWPFHDSEVKLVYEGRRLLQTFTNEVEMREALMNAPWVTITTTLKP